MIFRFLKKNKEVEMDITIADITTEMIGTSAADSGIIFEEECAGAGAGAGAAKAKYRKNRPLIHADTKRI